MPVYEVTIDGVTYEVESPKPLTDLQAYQYALQQAQQERAAGGDEMARLRNAQATIGAQPTPAAPQVPVERWPEREQRIKDRIDWLERQRQAVIQQVGPEAAGSMMGAYPDVAASLADLESEIAKAKKELPTDYASVGGAVGNVLGGLAGTAVPIPGGMALGTIGGGLLGTMIGGLISARQRGMTEEETADFLKERGIESVVLDAAGNLLFWGGGKVLGMLRASDPGYAEAVRALGGKIKPANPDTGLKLPAEKINPRDAVFGSTPEDTMRGHAIKGAQLITRDTGPKPFTPTPGQLSGRAGAAETLAIAKDRQHFLQVRREQERALQQEINNAIQKLRGNQRPADAGETVREAFDKVERATKNYLRPVWDSLGKHETVDFSPLSKAASQALDEDMRRRVPLLKGERFDWMRRIAEGGERMSPAEAHELLSELAARARDLQNSLTPDSKLLAFYSEFADRLRDQLLNAMAQHPEYAQARELYKRMMETVYADAFRAARRGGESAAAGRVIKVGETEGVEALKKLTQFARALDRAKGSLGPAELTVAARQAKQQAMAEFFAKHAGTPEAMAKLPSKMRDPDFKRTFEAAFRSKEDRRMIETLAQAAQQIRHLGYSAGSGPSLEAGAASVGAAVGTVTGQPAAGRAGAVAGRLAALFVPDRLAKAMTTPAIKAELPTMIRLMNAAARGATVAIPESTRLAIEALERIPSGGEGPPEEPPAR